MKKRMFAIGLALCLAIAPVGSVSAAETTVVTPTPTEAAPSQGISANENPSTTVKKGLTKVGSKYVFYQNGQKLKNHWRTVHGKRYYFNSKGYACTGAAKIRNRVFVFGKNGVLCRGKSGTVKYGKNLYYVDTNGQARTGWFLVGSRLYRADAAGRLCKSRTYQGIRFNKKGYAQNSTPARLKKLTMRIVSNITNSSMSQSEKLYACWKYVVSGRFGYVSCYPVFSDSDWYKDLAYQVLVSSGGDCYGYACVFAALAKEVGYNPYVVLGRVSGTRDGAADGLTRHCWVMIDGCYYDPEAEYAGWYKGVYGLGVYSINHTIQSYVKYV